MQTQSLAERGMYGEERDEFVSLDAQPRKKGFRSTVSCLLAAGIIFLESVTKDFSKKYVMESLEDSLGGIVEIEQVHIPEKDYTDYIKGIISESYYIEVDGGISIESPGKSIAVGNFSPVNDDGLEYLRFLSNRIEKGLVKRFNMLGVRAVRLKDALKKNRYSMKDFEEDVGILSKIEDLDGFLEGKYELEEPARWEPAYFDFGKRNIRISSVYTDLDEENGYCPVKSEISGELGELEDLLTGLTRIVIKTVGGPRDTMSPHSLNGDAWLGWRLRAVSSGNLVHVVILFKLVI